MNSTSKFTVIKICIVAIICFVLYISVIQIVNAKSDTNIDPVIVKKIVNDIKSAVQSRNFKILKSYVTKKERLFWAECYVNGDVVFDLSSFEEAEKIFMEESQNATIYVNERPLIEDELTMSIKTEGWAAEEPFVEFIFHATDGKFVLKGFCSSAKPDPNEPFGKPAQLPRQGPRVFKNVYFFHARIGEIVRLRAFEALRAYAVKQPLSMAECGKKAREMSVMEIINFLQRNSRDNEQIKFFNIHESLETEGWGGGYPFISFSFTETKDGWMWTGISYCKNRPEEHYRRGKIYYERY